MKELNYNNSNANKMKIGFAKRKQTLSRVIIGLFLLFCAIGVYSADFSKSQNAETVIGQVLTIATVIPAFMVEGKFKELKGEELKTFIETADPEQLAEYYNQKNEATRKELEAKIESKATKEEALAADPWSNEPIYGDPKQPEAISAAEAIANVQRARV